MKPERIQDDLHIPGDVAAAARDFLDEHPEWQASAGGRRLVRSYRFLSFKTASAFAHFAIETTKELDHPCALELDGGDLRLVLGSGEGLSDEDLALAAAISRAG